MLTCLLRCVRECEPVSIRNSNRERDLSAHTHGFGVSGFQLCKVNRVNMLTYKAVMPFANKAARFRLTSPRSAASAPQHPSHITHGPPSPTEERFARPGHAPTLCNLTGRSAGSSKVSAWLDLVHVPKRAQRTNNCQLFDFVKDSRGPSSGLVVGPPRWARGAGFVSMCSPA